MDLPALDPRRRLRRLARPRARPALLGHRPPALGGAPARPRQGRGRRRRPGKPGKLRPNEWSTVWRAPRLSARLLRRFEVSAAEARAVEYHRERYDGRGYYGIPAADQPLAAHFLVVADSFDAMTQRPALPRRPRHRGGARGDRAQHRHAVPPDRRQGLRRPAARPGSVLGPHAGGARGDPRRLDAVPRPGHPRRAPPAGAAGARRPRRRDRRARRRRPRPALAHRRRGRRGGVGLRAPGLGAAAGQPARARARGGAGRRRARLGLRGARPAPAARPRGATGSRSSSGRRTGSAARSSSRAARARPRSR